MNRSQIPSHIYSFLSRYIHTSGDITFVTASDSRFYESMRDNLISSIYRYEPNASVIVWDLGLSPDQVWDLEHMSAHRKMDILKYPEGDLPEHFVMKRVNYAFKTYIVYASLSMIKTRYAMYLDTGCGLRRKLNAERNIISKYGYYCPVSAHDVQTYTHPVVTQNFMTEQIGIKQKPMLFAGVQGWDMQNPKALSMLIDWYQLSRMEDNIDPQGATILNHRYDQTLLSIVYYGRFKKVPYLCKYRYNIAIHLNKK